MVMVVYMVIDEYGTLYGWKEYKYHALLCKSCWEKLTPAEGTEQRRAHRSKRGEYRHPGPNYARHCDGYDKFKGVRIYNLWMYLRLEQEDSLVCHSIKQPPGQYSHLLPRCCWRIWSVPYRFNLWFRNWKWNRDDADSNRYVSSPRNQRIEAWWGLFRKFCSTWSWWINFFKDLTEQRILHLASELYMDCLWFCFSDLVQQILDDVKEEWNTHYIRVSRFCAARLLFVPWGSCLCPEVLVCAVTFLFVPWHLWTTADMTFMDKC